MTKTAVDDLAILGGPSEFDATLHVGTPNLGDRQRLLDRINDILDRRWFTNAGPYVREFEKRVAKLVGARHCIATCNGTLALEIAIRALGLKGEVIVPSFTFVATAHALQWQEITPVFCDIDPITCNLDPRRIEQLVTPRTTGIIGVHLWGRPCDTRAIEQVARQCRLKVLYDASHAFGCTHRGRPIGTFGNAEVFSFHATKFLNTFEGGAIVTNNDELAQAARLMKNFGFVDLDKVIHVGSNGKMNEVSAAMGLTSLESMDAFVSANYRNYKLYEDLLSELGWLRLLAFDESQRNNYQYVVAEVLTEKTPMVRDDLIRILHAEKVRARRYFHPGCHRMEPYKSYQPNAGLLLPVTERMSQRVISLPTGSAIGPEQIRRIVRLLQFVGEHADEIDARLNGEKVAWACETSASV